MATKWALKAIPNPAVGARAVDAQVVVGTKAAATEVAATTTKAFSVRVLTVGERVVLSHPLCKMRTKDGAPRVVNT